MKYTTVEMIRIWAAVTGLLTVLIYFAGLWVQGQSSPTIAMLATAIGGFEIFFFVQDRWMKRRGKHG